jgi:hypothetical protein
MANALALTPKKARMARLKKVALWTGVGLLSYELFVALVIRRQNRRDVFNQAVARANATQKALVVVGSPDGTLVSSLVGRDYDCGELCIDERGCPKCKVQAVAKLTDALHELPDNSAVIFVAGTLEDVLDLPTALQQLQRVSGGDLFVAPVQPWTLTAFFHPGARRRIFSAPPASPTVTWKNLPWRARDVSRSFTVKLDTGARNKLPSFQ